MPLVEPGSTGESLFARVAAVLIRPEAAWEVIDAEPAEIGELYRTWVAPLAAIPAVCRAVSILALGGIHLFGVRYMPSVGAVVGQMAVTYVLTLGEVYVLAWVVDVLAPRFEGVSNRIQAFKLAAYSGTAAWVAGVFALLPTVGGLIAFLAGLYSLYLLYLGLPRLMKTPLERATSYFAVSLAVAFLLAVLIGALSSWVAGIGGPGVIST